jgi:mannosyl-3-phosphoglycerate phosphatase
MPNLTSALWPRARGLASRLCVRQRRNQFESRSRNRIVLFTDPDTLREDGHHDWTATREVVRELEDRGIAIVLWGNETRSEMELIQSDLNLQHPFISENGGGLFVRHGYFLNRPAMGRHIQSYDVVDFGRPYHEVAEGLHEVARRHECKASGFSVMSIEDVARECGLSLAQARLAKLREYDEPFRVADSEPATYSRICSALRRLGYRCFIHERFHHATGVADRTRSIRTLTSVYRQAYDGHALTIGVAKAPSETCLLQAVDIPLVVRSRDVNAARLAQKVPTARFIDAGPRGWSEAILETLDGRLGR